MFDEKLSLDTPCKCNFKHMPLELD